MKIYSTNKKQKVTASNSLPIIKQVERENGRVITKYQAGAYVFTVDLESDGYYFLSIDGGTDRRSGNFYPRMYIKQGMDFGDNEITIQTTSWGELNLDEIAPVIEGYNSALESAYAIMDAFPEYFK